jgi:hypothetical protein
MAESSLSLIPKNMFTMVSCSVDFPRSTLVMLYWLGRGLPICD